MIEKFPFDEGERLPQPRESLPQFYNEQPAPEDPAELSRRLSALLELPAYRETLDDAEQRVQVARKKFMDKLHEAGVVLAAPDNFCFTLTREGFGTNAPEGAPQNVYGWDDTEHKPNDQQAGETAKFVGNRVVVSHDNFRLCLVNDEDKTCVPYSPGWRLTVSPIKALEEDS